MRITRVFFDVDLRQSFEGLRDVAYKADAPLTEASTILFINSARTSFKMLTSNQYIVYYKNYGKRIPLEALRHLPQAFGGTQAEMSSAIEKSLREKIKFIQA